MSDTRTWVRHNLFRTRRDAVLTIVFGLLALWLLYKTLRFIFVTGRWTIIDAIKLWTVFKCIAIRIRIARAGSKDVFFHVGQFVVINIVFRIQRCRRSRIGMQHFVIIRENLVSVGRNGISEGQLPSR